MRSRLRSLWLFPLAVAAALLSVVVVHPGGTEYLKTRLDGGEADREKIEAVIALFNKYYGLYFDTGGKALALSEYPAENMVKRRIFQEISSWRKQRRALVHDKFSAEVERVEIVSPNGAVAESKERWVTWIRDLESGERFGKQLSDIQVRYFLSRKDDTWIVQDFRVYGFSDPLPELPERRWAD